MKAVVQRVARARVLVADRVVGEIDRGLLVYLGVERGDTERDLSFVARKVIGLRILPDHDGRMNRSIVDSHQSDPSLKTLVVSQFTLLGDVRKGNRPSYAQAEEPERARNLYERFAERIRETGLQVATGAFGEHMQVVSQNDGPVTLLIDSRTK